MCGITGIYNLNNEPVNVETLEKMTTVLKHRGPDDEGYLFANTKEGVHEIAGGEDTPEDVLSSENVYAPKQKIDSVDFTTSRFNLGFGHRRLSIIDLSPAGHQPMCNEDGSVWLICNGEVYNYLELIPDLKSKGHIFKSHTDTEVIIHAYEEYGVDCVHKFNGMFAFAIWDNNKKRLFCARDRFGIKPFYYYLDDKKFQFASELKAIIADPTIKRKPNDEIVYDYLAYGSLDHTENTFFEDINQLQPAHYLIIENSKQKIKRYWDLEPSKVQKGVDDQKCTKKFYELFEDSIKLRLRSDVPVGTCLSGGLDSSSIVCVANKHLKDKSKQKTFSSCFENKKYDERKYIQYVIDKTGAETNFTFPSGEELFELIKEVIWHQDEPFGSTSIFAQWHVMKLAKERDVRVLLDGQGADELLAGYHGYYISFFADLIKTFQFKKVLDEINYYSKYHSYSKLYAIAMAIIYLAPPLFKFKIKVKYITKIKKGWLNTEFVRANNKSEIHAQKYKSYLHDHLYQVLTSGLPALLHYEDRNSMAFSIEARVPFLDYRLVEFVFSLPNNQKINKGVTKIILRNAMKGVLPEEVIKRMDKMGFVTPEDIWFRTVAKDKVLEIINSDSFKKRKYFKIDKIKEEFDAYCKGEKNISSTIWRWINLELWLRRFID